MENLEEGKFEEEEKLEFGTEHLLKSAKEDFIGEVIYAVYPCHCEMCEKGAGKIEGEPPKRIHIKILPYTVYDKVQHQWYSPTKTRMSRYGALNENLEKMGIIDEFKSKGISAFMGKVFQWHWGEIKVGIGDRVVGCWLPVRLLPKDEAEKLKKERFGEGKVDLS